jgi:hypothetical protein
MEAKSPPRRSPRKQGTSSRAADEAMIDDGAASHKESEKQQSKMSLAQLKASGAGAKTGAVKSKKKGASQRKLEFGRSSLASSSEPKGKKGGRKPQSKNWTQEMINALLDAVEKIEPTGPDAWKVVATLYYRATKELRDYKSLRTYFRKLARTKPKTGQSSVPAHVERARSLLDHQSAKAMAVELDDAMGLGPNSGSDTDDYGGDPDFADSQESVDDELEQPESPVLVPNPQPAAASSAAKPASPSKTAAPKAKKGAKKRKAAELMPTAHFDLSAASPAAKGRRRVDAAIGDLAHSVSASLSAPKTIDPMLMMMQMNQSNMAMMMAMMNRCPPPYPGYPPTPVAAPYASPFAPQPAYPASPSAGVPALYSPSKPAFTDTA